MITIRENSPFFYHELFRHEDVIDNRRIGNSSSKPIERPVVRVRLLHLLERIIEKVGLVNIQVPFALLIAVKVAYKYYGFIARD